MTFGIIHVDDGKPVSFQVTDGRIYRDLEMVDFKEQYFDQVLCIARFDNLMVYNITLPQGIKRKNIINALKNELNYLLPLDISAIVWCVQFCEENIFSVQVLLKEKFVASIECLKQHNLKCDILYPVLKVSDFDLMSLKNFSSESMQIPKEIRPVRNKLSKMIYWFLFTAAILLFISVYIGKYRNFDKENTKAFRVIQQEFSNLSTEKELFEKIGNLKPNLQSVFPVLQDLSQMLPKHMWIINYVQHGEMIDMTIESSKDESNFFRFLSGAKKFQVISLRKSRGGNSSVVFYIKLKGCAK